MGSAINSNSSFEDGSYDKNETRVVLNVYDLTPINNYTYWFGFGIFHSGIEGSLFLPCFLFPFADSLFGYLFHVFTSLNFCFNPGFSFNFF